MNKSKLIFLNIIVFLILNSFITEPLISQEIPYPIIFIHGLDSYNGTWSKEGADNDILDFLLNAGLKFGGNLDVTLDYNRSSLSLMNTKEEDVHLFPGGFVDGNFYTLNFDVHASGTPGIFKTPSATVLSLVVQPWDTQFNVDFPVKFNSGDIIRINNEFMKVTNVGDDYLEVDRAILGSAVEVHNFENTIWNLSLESNQASIAKQGWGLKKAIDAIRTITGASKVILVGHSMGGLTAREYLNSNYFENDVAKLVTFGTPHLGSNMDEVSQLITNFKGIDDRSEAVRDLHYTYSSSHGNPAPPYGDEPDDSIYLFGGFEGDSDIPKSFYSLDYNADGDENDSIRGLCKDLTSLPISIDYTWLVSQWENWGPNLDGDFAVRIQRQFPWYRYNADGEPFIEIGDTLMAHIRHDKETNDYYSLIRGLDEPDNRELSYEIELNKTFAFFSTYQTNNHHLDRDWFRFSLNEAGKIQIALTSLPAIPGRRTISSALYRAGETSPVVSSTNDIGGNSIFMTTAELEADMYYLKISSEASSNSWENPGHLRITKINNSNMKIYADANPKTIIANGSSIITITGEIQDQDGNLIPTATNEITFSIISGASSGQLIGQNPVVAVGGQAQISLKSTTTPGIVVVEASSPGVVSGSCTIIVYSGAATTEIGGHITQNATLTLSQSPYAVTSNLYIDNGVVLTIEPGVVVMFKRHKYLEVNGALIANGTTSLPITFTANTQNPYPEFWEHIYFKESYISNQSVLNHCNILFGDKGIYLSPRANPIISNISMNNNTYNGISLVRGSYSSDLQLKKLPLPYVINGDFTIKIGGTCSIEAGAILKFTSESDLIIKGALNAQGMSDNSVIFTSIKDDFHGGDTDNNGETFGSTNDWGGFYIDYTINDSNTKLINCEILYAGYSGIWDSHPNAFVIHPEANPTIENVIFRNCKGNGIELLSGRYSSNILLNIVGVPYYVGDLTINSGAELCINPGVIIKFKIARGLKIKGKLNAMGTTLGKIIFTSLRDDAHGGDTDNNGNTSGTAGDWDGIEFYETIEDENCILSNCEIMFAGRDNNSPLELHPYANPQISHILLENNMRNGIELWGGSYDSDIGLDVTAIPYIIRDDITINEGAVLRVNPKVVLKFDSRTDLLIYGGLIAQGTSSNHIIFTSLSDDEHGGDTNGDGVSSGAPGDWGGIWFGDTVVDSNSIMSYCDIMYAGSGNRSFDSPIELNARANPSLNNISLFDNTRNGIDVAGGSYSSDIIFNITEIPYMVRRDLIIEPSATLTIQQGIIVKFDSRADLYIKGALKAEGTAENRIIFTSLNDDSYGGDTNGDGPSVGTIGYWGGIRFYNSAIDTCSILDYCNLTYAGSGGYDTNDRPIILDGLANPQITNCLLENNTKNAIDLVPGRYSSDFHLDILNFPYLIRNDITVASQACLTIDPGVILKFENGGDLYIEGRIEAIGSSEQLINFTSSKDDFLGGDSNGDGPSAGSPGDWGGIRFSDTSDDLNCVLDNVKILFGGSGGYGTNRYPLVFNNSGPRIQRITIANSQSHGVACFNVANPDFGGGDKGSIGQNKFLDFVMTENKFAFYNEGTSDIFARHNFWETNDAEEITRNIYDKNDNSVKGEVFFEPFNLTEDVIAPSVTILSPNGNEQYIIGSSQDITWSASDNVGIFKLYFYLSTDEGNSFLLFDSLFSNPGILTWDVEGPASELCKLKIIAQDYSGNNGYDISHSCFSILDTTNFFNYPPTTPLILYPSSGIEVIPSEFLIWTKSTDNNPNDKISYTLQIASDSLFANPVIEQSGITGANIKMKYQERKIINLEGDNGEYAVYLQINSLDNYSNLIDDSTYYWRVKAVDNHGASSDFTDGTSHFFFNKTNTAPHPVIAGFSPSNGLEVRTNTPEISWHPAEDPDLSDNASTLRYHLQLDTDGEFLNDFQFHYTTSYGLNTLEAPDQLSENLNWYYRVQTIDDENLTSDWSSVQNFWVNAIDEPPVPFALLAPIDNSVVGQDTINFIWQSTLDRDPNDSFIFILEYSTDSTFRQNVIMQNCQSDTSYKIEPNLFDDVTYFWRVKAKDNDNLYCWGSESEKTPWKFSIRRTNVPDEKNEVLVKTFKIYQNYPNPFNNSTQINYQLPVSGHVKIGIINMNGQLIKMLVNEEQSAGHYSANWSGQSQDGKQLSSGVYFIRFVVTGNSGICYQETKKIMYIK